MLLYDVTNERSFLSVRQWIEAVDVSLHAFFVTQKTDLKTGAKLSNLNPYKAKDTHFCLKLTLLCGL